MTWITPNQYLCVVTEFPTPQLRWRGGVLEQNWVVRTERVLHHPNIVSRPQIHEVYEWKPVEVCR